MVTSNVIKSSVNDNNLSISNKLIRNILIGCTVCLVLISYLINPIGYVTSKNSYIVMTTNKGCEQTYVFTVATLMGNMYIPTSEEYYDTNESDRFVLLDMNLESNGISYMIK